EALSETGIEANGNLNFLKSGLVYADALTTVSEKYAEEIRSSEEFGCGLQTIAEKRRKDLTGILNGIDYSIWDPSVDEHIPHKYDYRSLDLKRENKLALLQAVKLPVRGGAPLIGIISRLVDQKGLDLIDEAMDALIKLNVQLVVLGTGERKYHDMLTKAAKKHPETIAVDLSFNEKLAHLIEAGSDMFLMPSRYEPCGLNQIYSLRYGTVPVVRATGGLEDTIEDYNPSSGSGTGFKFTKYDSTEMMKAIQRAVKVFADEGAWKRIMKNGMGKDFSWESSAKKYIQLYRSLARK
ncbi:MAG: glycosyltransferase, partial [Ignavibacteria bacterium]|nr:glycosyltransferase [Ignavibacteria bacterium]